ncbi:hypothetical protein IFM89_010861 [Coptis chinensis]|uniref:GDSL esterase/lipase n=1 Tax=Coptis chinensis TaxID=261450 RepID=A0A835I145_9MAGN|nr:hypothetical protein IFM89_010861 [Coptis chinensis]
MFSASIPRYRPEPSEDQTHSISAIFVFGDSTVDPGNNNYIDTLLKSNFPPYGRDLPSHTPTGRFSNGKLSTDYIASHLGIKEYVPPYLNKSLTVEELRTGNVIPIQKQLEYFKEYQARLEAVMGAEKLENHIRRAGFVVSCGTNDFAANYFSVPNRRAQYNVTGYQNFLLKKTRNFLQGLLDHGAQKIGIVGVPPIGCLPIVITTNSNNAISQRGCIESYSSVAKEYNDKLQNELQSMQKKLGNSGTIIVYGDIYEPLLDMIKSYKKFGFEEWRRGCCATGLFEFGYLCNPQSLEHIDLGIKYDPSTGIYCMDFYVVLILNALDTVSVVIAGASLALEFNIG